MAIEGLSSYIMLIPENKHVLKLPACSIIPKGGKAKDF
jgi:hypothetical protein